MVLGLHQRSGDDWPTASLHDKTSLRRPNTAQNQSFNVIIKATLFVMKMDTQKAYHKIQFLEMKLICDRSLNFFRGTIKSPPFNVLKNFDNFSDVLIQGRARGLRLVPDSD